VSKSRRRQKRIALRLLAGAGALLLLIIAGCWVYKFCLHWQVRRFVSRGQTYLSWGDYKSATLTARRVLELDATDADALRILAEVCEREGVNLALDWRRQVVKNRPESVSDVVALAQTALKFGDITTAKDALERIGAKAQTNAAYHEALGQLAGANKQPDQAERHFEQALKLQPNDQKVKLELATVQLRSDIAATQDNGRAVLQTLLDDKSLRATAAKTLLQNAVEHKDPELVRFAELLSTFPEAPFADRLISVQIFARLHLPQFASALTSLQTEAAEAPDKLTVLISWMSANNLSLVALDWVKRLPSELLTKDSIPVAIADCYASTQDWAGLEQWCKKSAWKALEFLRHAYLARAARGGNDSINADLEWSKAIKAAVGPNDLETLQRAAAKWGWKKESIDLLWTLTNGSPKQRAALETLYEYYSDQADTGNLYRVAARLSRVAPDDLEIQNNVAQLALLLNVDTERARALAAQLYQQHQSDVNVASTYAFALYSQKHAEQAVRVMSGLREEDLKRPEVAAYYGIMLKAAGDREKAQPFLDLGKTARLLPEEKRLLDDAIAN
jgi:Flp pilus assembly protein TadD